MNQKEITISGRTVPVVFTVQTLINYERITKESFFKEGQDFHELGYKAALVYAAIIAADPHSVLEYEELVNADKASMISDIGNAFKVVDSLASEFFDVSDNKQPEQTEGESPKN